MATSAVGLAGGPIGIGITAGLAGVSGIAAIFQGHSQAVQNEAAALNQAWPKFTATLQSVFQALNARSISEADAKTYIDGAVTQYYTDVSGGFRGSIQGRWPLTDTAQCKHSASRPMNCNGPCSIGGQFVEPWACSAKKLVDTGGTWTANENPLPHAGFAGGPPITLTYAKPSGVEAKLGSTGTKVAAGLAGLGVVGLAAAAVIFR